MGEEPERATVARPLSEVLSLTGGAPPRIDPENGPSVAIFACIASTASVAGTAYVARCAGAASYACVASATKLGTVVTQANMDRLASIASIAVLASVAVVAISSHLIFQSEKGTVGSCSPRR